MCVHHAADTDDDLAFLLAAVAAVGQQVGQGLRAAGKLVLRHVNASLVQAKGRRPV